MKLLATIWKEFLLLIRDPGGMALIFLMPLVMLIVMALIQDAPFRDYQESKLEVLLVNQDQDSLAAQIEKAFAHAPQVKLVPMSDSAAARKLVAVGTYKAAIVIPAGTSASLRVHIASLMQSMLAQLGIKPGTPEVAVTQSVSIKIFFDPAIKVNYRQALASSLERMITEVQSVWLLKEMQHQLAPNHTETTLHIDFSKLTQIQQEFASPQDNSINSTNSVQHNVPAWTMFAMFLILFPLAGNFIREREEGSMLRLRLIAGSSLPAIAGKFIFYLLVCLSQFVLMMAAGVFVMPLFHLSPLAFGHNLAGTLLAAAAVGLAATGYGMVIAVYFKTAQQALAFGSTSVIILAALGGVWVPAYVMPPVLQQISAFSPLNWGLECFNDLFLREATTMTILPQVLKLTAFAAVALGGSVWIHQSRTVS